VEASNRNIGLAVLFSRIFQSIGRVRWRVVLDFVAWTIEEALLAVKGCR
jgi:hypothetical protein